jgi:hypothetical protein
MRLFHHLCATFLICSASIAGATNSSFDVDLEGWTGFNTSKDFVYAASGGNPGGYLEFQENDGAFSSVQAPAKFLGDQSKFIGGQLQFDLREIVPTNGPVGNFFGRVLLSGGPSGSDITLKVVGAPPAVWTSYALDLTPQAWGTNVTNFTTILSDLQEIRINLDSRNGAAKERVGLDNVSFVLPPVPLPSAALLLLGALGGLAVMRCRRVRV